MGSGISSSSSSSSLTSTSKSSSLVKPLSNFYTIANNFKTFLDLQKGLKEAGLESSELIIGIDFTKSNLYNGSISFSGKSLHELSLEIKNPYEFVLENICNTMSGFDDDSRIPCYGFGDVTTRNQKVFSFKENDEPCHGLEEVKMLYRYLLPNISLAGPTSFAPIVRKAIHTVVQHDYRYHVLLIIADGQVTDSDLQDTMNSIVEASNFALSIILVGVGDGPWDMMQKFDDELPKRRFDNFQFVCVTEAERQAKEINAIPEIAFALLALMEIPEQYKLVRSLRLMDPKIGEKYFQRLKLKEVQCLGPPPIRPPLSIEVGNGARLTRSQSMTPNGRRSSSNMITPTNHSPLISTPSFVALNDPPKDFLCPISHEIMTDPVIAQDGFTYERSRIEMWFYNENITSPMTNEVLPSLALIPNYNLKSQITAWIDESRRSTNRR